jgi:hypothetical protein
MICGSTPGRDKSFLFSKSSRSALRPKLTPIKWVLEVKNEWSHTSAPAIYLHIMDSNTLTVSVLCVRE